METDRFGNRLAPGLPYARGAILRSTEDDFRKLQRAWGIIRRAIEAGGRDAVFNFSGLERSLPLDADDLALADDEIAPALHHDRLTALALAHLGGSPGLHDAMLFNRLTAVTVATHLALVGPGDTVVGVSPTYSHPTIVRAAGLAGAGFIEAGNVDHLREILDGAARVRLVALTRLAVTYDLLPLDDIQQVVALARARGALVYADDAGGARVGPAIFDQPRTLELGVDLGATGLDKYGTIGPRLGILGGRSDLVSRIRARAFELGLEARPMLYRAAVRSLEAYSPARVRALVDCTRDVAAALRAVFGVRLTETPVTAQLKADDVLEVAMERAGLTRPTLVPYEATAALAMLLLEDYGVLTVHFAGMPPGTGSLLIKFVLPETLERFGGAERLAKAVDSSLDKLATLIAEPDRVRSLLLRPA